MWFHMCAFLASLFVSLLSRTFQRLSLFLSLHLPCNIYTVDFSAHPFLLNTLFLPLYSLPIPFSESRTFSFLPK